MEIIHYRNPNGFTIEQGKTAFIMPLKVPNERRADNLKLGATEVVEVYDPASRVFVAGSTVYVPEVDMH